MNGPGHMKANKMAVAQDHQILQNLFLDIFPLLIFHNQKWKPKILGKEFFCSGGEHLEPGVGVEVLEGGLKVFFWGFLKD